VLGRLCRPVLCAHCLTRLKGLVRQLLNCANYRKEHNKVFNSLA
jgi:hypothetical protein